MTAPHERPGIVDVAFWSWLAGAVLLIVGGAGPLLLSFDTVRRSAPGSMSDDALRSWLLLFKGAAVICILLGMAIGYLAGRTRRGDRRFQRAAVALSLAAVVLLAVGAFLHLVTLLSLLAVIALIVGAGTVTRPAASAWFDAVEQPEGGNA